MKFLLLILLLLPSLDALLAKGNYGKQKWQWPRATARDQNLDAKGLDQLVQLIDQGKEFPNLHSLLIIRNGKMVVEEYFAGYQCGQRHTLQSVSKSFTSALVGIALFYQFNDLFLIWPNFLVITYIKIKVHLLMLISIPVSL